MDKTGLIRDLLGNWGEVNLFTRPRRFGKTLNMSMLKSFFEIGADRGLFDGLAISEDNALCVAYMGKFPVVFISLKGLDGLTFEDACSMLGEIIQKSLALLTELLYKHYGQKAILLIDEYDVPLDKAFVHGYNEEMVALLRGLFGQALKTNDYLQFAVLTGCLRVSKGASLRD